MRQVPLSPLSFDPQRVANVPEHPPPSTRLRSCAHIANRRLSRIIGASSPLSSASRNTAITSSNERKPIADFPRSLRAERTWGRSCQAANQILSQSCLVSLGINGSRFLRIRATPLWGLTEYIAEYKDWLGALGPCPYRTGSQWAGFFAWSAEADNHLMGPYAERSSAH